MREIAAGRPGLVTQVGLGTYVDPRQTGGKQNARTTEDLVEVVTLRGRGVAAVPRLPDRRRGHPRHDRRRGRQPHDGGRGRPGRDARDGDGRPEQRRHRHRPGPPARHAAAACRMRDVKVPGALVDHVYVDPDQWQTYITRDSPYYAGALRRPVRPEPPLPLDVRKIIARRSLLEFPPGAICNLGFGISQLIGRVAWEEGITDQLVLTVEQGIFGGVPVAGNEGGAGFNYQAMIDQPYMFDFYDGGGLDIASLSFAEVDAEGNVNVHAFEGRVRGPGGFPNISARTRTDQLRRDADRAGPRARDRRRASAIAQRGQPRQVRARGPRDLVQRPARPRARPAGPLHHRAGGVRARGRRARADRGRAGHRRRARRPRRGWASGRASPTDLRTMDPRACTRPGRWAWPPTSGRAVVSGLVALELGRGRPPRARQPAAQPRHAASCSRSWTPRSRRSRRPTPGDVRAVVVSGRGERAFSRRARTSASSRRSAAPAAGERHELEEGVGQPPGRAADADDRRDRGQRARRRPRARALLRPPGRVGAGQARPARGPPRGDPGRRRHAAPAAGRRHRRGPRS